MRQHVTKRARVATLVGARQDACGAQDWCRCWRWTQGWCCTLASCRHICTLKHYKKTKIKISVQVLHAAVSTCALLAHAPARGCVEWPMVGGVQASMHLPSGDAPAHCTCMHNPRARPLTHTYRCADAHMGPHMHSRAYPHAQTHGPCHTPTLCRNLQQLGEDRRVRGEQLRQTSPCTRTHTCT
jgi:hypothetical protein